MQRPTGPGKIQEYADQLRPAIRARLYNFDFDDMRETRLKPEHVQWLDETVVPLLRGGAGSVWMRGSASQVGADAYNLKLSQQRVERVAGYLKTQGVEDRQLQLEWVGERPLPEQRRPPR